VGALALASPYPARAESEREGGSREREEGKGEVDADTWGYVGLTLIEPPCRPKPWSKPPKNLGCRFYIVKVLRISGFMVRGCFYPDDKFRDLLCTISFPRGEKASWAFFFLSRGL
jgi:hypothetical protein